MFNKGFLYQRLGTHLNLPSEPTEFKLSCRGGCAAKRHLAQQLVEQGELRVEPEQISGLVLLHLPRTDDVVQIVVTWENNKLIAILLNYGGDVVILM